MWKPVKRAEGWAQDKAIERGIWVAR